MNTLTPTDVLEIKLKELEEQWEKDLKSNDKAGGNSGTNLQLALIRGELEKRKNDG